MPLEIGSHSASDHPIHKQMALTVGDRLGHYDVTALIGEGGMGQVYRATETQLGRDVALKILPDAFAADPDRLARFQREAHGLASLNHPGIAAIYGIEKSEDTQALVLELVEGPTLADRIAKGPIPLDEALPIAKQIAEALEAAHEAGVIHRDLNPEPRCVSQGRAQCRSEPVSAFALHAALHGRRSDIGRDACRLRHQASRRASSCGGGRRPCGGSWL